MKDYYSPQNPAQRWPDANPKSVFMTDPETDMEVVPAIVKVKDTAPMRVLRVSTYVLVCITCVAVLFMTLEMYLTINDLRQAVHQWLEGFTNGDLLGG